MNDNDDMYENEKPNSFEFLLTGVLGVIIFTITFSFAINGFLNSTKREIQLFFISASILSVFELPRYIILITQREFVSRIAYSFHILAGVFYFFCLAMVCFLWHDVLEVTGKVQYFFSKKGLFLANIIFGSVQVTSFFACILSPSLKVFLKSPLFIIFVFEEIIQNLIYTTTLSFYGLRLLIRMRNYVSSTIHRQKSLPCTEGDTINNNSFQSFVTNLTLTLVVVTVSDFCRLFLCVLQEISLTTNASLYSSKFPKYGVLWFLLAEFLPRGAALIILLSLMSRAKKRPKASLTQNPLPPPYTSAKSAKSSSLIDSLIISSSEDDDYLITERMKYANDEINRSLNRVRNSNDTETRTLSDVLSTNERD